jgi:hypothetical protein
VKGTIFPSKPPPRVLYASSYDCAFALSLGKRRRLVLETSGRITIVFSSKTTSLEFLELSIGSNSGKESEDKKWEKLQIIFQSVV